MRLIPSENHEGPKPITPMIRAFFGLIVANLLAIPLAVVWAYVHARPFPGRETPWLWVSPQGGHIYLPFPLHYVEIALVAFNLILVLTFVWMNARD